MSTSFKAYKTTKNARRLTLYSLAAAIVIVAGIYALRTFLNRDTAKPVTAAQPPAAIEPPSNIKAVALPAAAPAQAKSQSLAAQQPAPAPVPQKVAAAVVPNPASASNTNTAPASSPAITQPVVANAPLPDEASKLVTEADNDLKTGNFIAARDRLNDAVRMLQGSGQQAVVKSKLEQLSGMWLYSKDVIKDDKLCTVYTVRPGDSMENIGKKFKVPHEFLMEINKITRPESLQVGQQLKVVNGPFRAIVSRPTYTMDIYLQTTYVRSFKVGLGQEKMETPTGLWRAAVGGKMIKPKWTDPKTGKTYKGDDPDYPLGVRWIALDGIEGNAKGRTGFAIHGTKDPQSIGTKSSQGCIRLHNDDVVMVYNMMMPAQSEVRVVD